MGRILPDQYFDHEADIGIIGRGKSIEQAFCHAAHAMFAIMFKANNLWEARCVVDV